MNLLHHLFFGPNPITLFELYLANAFGGPLELLAIDLVLILTIHAVSMFFITVIFMKTVEKFAFCKTFFGGFLIYLMAILVVLQSHFVDIVFLSIALDALKVFPSPLSTFYYVVGLYTTVGSNYNPAPEWQGLALIIPFCGLFAFSLSGSALFTMLGYFLASSKPSAKKNDSL